MVIRTKGVQHVGIPVSNIELSLTWYKEMLGLEAEFVMESSGELLSTAVNLPGADLRFGHGGWQVGFSEADFLRTIFRQCRFS